MWTIECDGDVLGGKQQWLRPGKKFVMGRTQGTPGDGTMCITDKTISRQHIIVQVDAVGAQDCANPRSRSRITIKDLDTKIGTLVNGEQIRGKTHALDRVENDVILGRCKHHFIFKWVPLALAFSFTGKEKKADPWTPLYEQLGPLDIKVLKEYEHGYTTHVVASKRNTPKGLQALIDGKYIVENTYVKAIVDAAKAIEDDFSTFPDALHFLPPRGKEPTERPATTYSPDPARQDMFDGYTFIFYSQQQFDTLLAPITGGRGKALFREVIPDKTTVEEFVEYVKQVAGEKGLGELEDGSEGKGVVVVKFNPTGGQGNEWYADFSIQVALSLGLRLIEQNEFLDAILGSDGSVLRRSLEVSSTWQRTATSTTQAANRLMVAPTTQAADRSMAAPESVPAESAPSQPPRRGRGRRTVAKFTGFGDDDFNAPVNMSSIPELEPVAPAPAPEPIEESQSLFVTQQDTDMTTWREPSEEPEPEPVIQPRTTRKRQATPIDEEERQGRLAPSFVKLKKRRLEEEEARRERGESTPITAKPGKPVEPPKEKTPEPPVTEKKKPARRTKKGGDSQVEEAMHKRMEEQERAARIERDAQLAIMADINIDEVRSGIEILEMSVGRTRTITRPGGRADESERWDDKWNGRRNFKKFRRRGVPVSRDRERVIVSLEEVKNKEFGIGDEYWVDHRREEERESQKRGKSQGRKGRQVTEPVENSDSETHMRNGRRAKQRSAPAPAAKSQAKKTKEVEPEPEPEPEPVFIVSSEEDNDDDLIEHPELEPPPRPVAKTVPPKPVPKNATRTPRAGTESQKTPRARSESQTLQAVNPEPEPEPRTARKRTAEPMAKPAPAKKAKQGVVDKPVGRRRAVEEDSDDDMRFGFGRRKR